jgi:exodeoxyribonuclease V beta subunit
VLEAVDFGRWEQPSTERIIAEKLRAFGFEPGWGSAVARLVRDAAEAELFPEDGVSLGRLQPEDRIVEMEFYHPLNLLSPRVLRDVFARFGRAEALRGFPERLERLTFAPLRGHMKGFIDLVAVHRGRFYLLDWKSNYLGGERADYRSDRLAGPMQDEFYVLQYHIYTLALDLYLRLRRPGYDYARDFGGVAYVFLRGLDRDTGPDVGVFRDRPEPELVRALGRALIPDYD